MAESRTAATQKMSYCAQHKSRITDQSQSSCPTSHHNKHESLHEFPDTSIALFKATDSCHGHEFALWCLPTELHNMNIVGFSQAGNQCGVHRR